MEDRLLYISTEQFKSLIRDAVRATVSEIQSHPPLMTKAQVASYLGKSVPTIDRYMREGMPFRKEGKGHPEFLKSDIDRWLRERF